MLPFAPCTCPMMTAKAQHPLCHWPRQPVVFGGQSDSDPRPLSTPYPRCPLAQEKCPLHREIEKEERNLLPGGHIQGRAHVKWEIRFACADELQCTAMDAWWVPGQEKVRAPTSPHQPGLRSRTCGAPWLPRQSAGQQVPHQNSSGKQEIKPVRNFGKLYPSTSLQAALQVVGAETGQESSSTSIKFWCTIQQTHF